MQVKFMLLGAAALLVGCPSREDPRLAERADVIENLRTENLLLNEKLVLLSKSIVKADGSGGAADAPASSSQIDEGTVLIYDPDLPKVTACDALTSKNVTGSVKLTDLPVGVIVTHSAYTASPREMWVLLTLDGACKRSYEIERAGSSTDIGVLPFHFTGTPGSYDTDPPSGPKHHRLTLHRVHDQASVLEKDKGKYLVPKAGFDSQTPIVFTGGSTTKNDDICTKWTTVLQDIWTDTGSNPLVASVSCYTTPASAPKCDPGGGTACPDF